MGRTCNENGPWKSGQEGIWEQIRGKEKNGEMKTEMAGRCSKASSGDEDEEWRLKAVNRAEWVSN